MKKSFAFLMMLVASSLLPCSCAKSPSGKANQSKPIQNVKTMKTEMKSLVVFFSHTGENYAVGNITKGNTHIVAEMIADIAGADIFEIEPVNPYPSAYDACVDVAKREKDTKARPAIKADKDISGYDVVFVGYPNWWGDMPMAVYTFIEAHDWNGKTVMPFCTHEGSGLSATERYLTEACAGAVVAKGLALRGSTAQNSQAQARDAVEAWLDNAELLKQ